MWKILLTLKEELILKLYPPGPTYFESTFIEIIIPNKKNIVAGCVYRHPSTLISIEEFSKNYLETILPKWSSENKITLTLNLLESETHAGISFFYNTVLSNFLAPHILQPTRSVSKSLIDNIFFDTIDYPSKSGNLNIQLADHLLQFALLEDFFQPSFRKKHNIKEWNFKHFNKREFKETIDSIDVYNVLKLNKNDPNFSLENIHNHVHFILDEFAPFKKLNKREIKLKSKPWISKEILFLMWKRDKLFSKYHKCKNPTYKPNLFSLYKVIRNEITKLKRDNKIKHYKNFFEVNKKRHLQFGKLLGP